MMRDGRTTMETMVVVVVNLVRMDCGGARTVR